MAVQWLRLYTFSAEGVGLILDRIKSHVLHDGNQKKKKFLWRKCHKNCKTDNIQISNQYNKWCFAEIK